MATKDLGASYTIATAYEPKGWYYADQTQRLANHLPRWNKIRKDKHSVGQTFLNAVYGVPLSDLEERLEEATRAQFAATYPLDDLDILKRAELPEWVETDEPTVRANHVPNSSFEIWTNPARLPDGWRHLGKAEIVTGLEGRNAVRLTVVAHQVSSVYQDVTVRMRPNEPWVASVWYKIPQNSLTAPASDFGLKVKATHADGTTSTTQGILSATTAGNWRRKTLALQYAKETVELRVEVTVKDVPASFNFTAQTLDLDCIQVEPGGKASPWRPDIFDALPYVSNERRSSILLAGANTAHYVDNLEDFWRRSIPTRASYVSSTSGTYAAVKTAGAVEVTDFGKKTWQFLFETTGRRILKRGSDVPGDLFPEKDIVARDQEGDLRRVENPVIEALTFFAGYLWALVKEVDWNGALVRTLHVLDPRSPHPEPAYLESLSGIQIPSNVPIGSSIVRLEFKNEDRQHIYLSTTTTQYTVRLHYDLFTIDAEARLLFLREDYATVTPM